MSRLLHPEASLCEASSAFLKLNGRRQCVVPFLLAILACLSFSAAGKAQVPGSDAIVAAAPQAQKTLEKGTAPTENPLAPIQSAIGNLHSPSLQALAGVLGLSPAQIGRQQFEDSSTGLEEISGLGEAGTPAVAVKWQRAGRGQNPQMESTPKVYLLSWDGKSWQASYLVVSSDALTLDVLPSEGNEASLFAVIIYRGITAVPYPVIFRFQDHHAALVWDGRADSSSYTGYNYGSVEFKKAGGSNVPVMVAAGQADPGLLMFPASQENTGRGFQVATAYLWKNGAYVPVRKEYTQNRDYLLYSFIAALHLHEYQQAYSLIDPGQFLRTKKPSLKLFRERIQNAWPEFIDDKIFEVPARQEIDLGSHAFVLKLGGGKMNVYEPTFTPGPNYRLTGLSRTESNY